MKQRKSDRRHSFFPYTFLSAILLTSCATAPPPKTAEVVDDALPESTEIRDDWAAGAGDSGRVDDGWIATFNDQMLNELVDEAIHNNLNLRLAASQVDRAAGLTRMAGASLKPAVGLGGSYGETWSQTDLLSGNSYNAALTVSWEVDVWGKLRSRKAAGEAGLEATVADFEYARQSIAATTAKTWFLATEITQQLALSNQSVEIFSEILEIVEAKEEVGQVSMQDVYLTAADVASAEEAAQQAAAVDLPLQQAAARGSQAAMGRRREHGPAAGCCDRAR